MSNKTKLEKMVNPKKVRKMYRQAINDQMTAEFQKRTNRLLFRLRLLTVALFVMTACCAGLVLVVVGAV